MKKRGSLSIFAILMTALLVFSGSASAVSAKDESYSRQVTHRDTIGSPVEDRLSPPAILGWFGDEKITLKQIKDTLRLTDLHVDDETLEGILGHPVAPGKVGTLRDAAEIAVIKSRYLEFVGGEIFAKAYKELVRAALGAAGYVDIKLPWRWGVIKGFFSIAKFWDVAEAAKEVGIAYWTVRIINEYRTNREAAMRLLEIRKEGSPFFEEHGDRIMALARNYVEAKENEQQIINFRNSIANLIRERVAVYREYQTGRYTGGVTATPTTVIVVNEGEYPISNVVLINEIPLWPDERSEPFLRIDAGGKGVLSFVHGVERIDHLEFKVVGAKLRIPFSIMPALPIIRTTTISQFGDYAPKEVEFDASHSFISQEATLLHYEWDFGDGTRERGEKVSHKYGQPGSYTVSLRVSTTLGSSTTTKVIEVKNPVSARFTVAPEDGPLGTVFQFDASASSTAVGNIVSHRWDFGDGSPAGEGIHVNHEYASEGFWTVMLTVTNDYGVSAVSRRTAFVGTHGPTHIWDAIDHDITWRPAFSPYILAGNVQIRPGAVLTILPGTEVRFKSGASLSVVGGLAAEGTKESPIIFTSHESEPKPGDWGDWRGGLALSGRASLRNVIVEYGQRIRVTSSDVTISDSIIRHNNYGIQIENSAPSITNNTITGNSVGIQFSSSNAVISENTISNNGHGIRVSGISNPTITNNVITDNSSWAIVLDANSSGATISGNTISGPKPGIYIEAGTITSTLIWGSTDAPYVIECRGVYPRRAGITVAEGATLAISPEVIVKFEERKHFMHMGLGRTIIAFLTIQGSLVADGTPEQPIIFTSLRDDLADGDTNGDENATSPAKGDWRGLIFEATSSGNILDNIVVRYARYGVRSYSSDLAITNSTITDCLNGIHLHGASPTITGNTISGNNYGISAANGSNPTISDNDIEDNLNWGVYNADPSIVINAKNNWWGHGSGPLDESDDRNTGGLYNPDGKGDRVSDYVDYKPWKGMNIHPNQPSNVLPADGDKDVVLIPTLQSSAFSDPDAGDSHAASHWQLTTMPGDYSSPVFDSGRDTENLISITVPGGKLNYFNTYYWRARHQDNHGAWSEWSVETTFATMRLPADVSGDGQVNAVDLAAVATAFNSPAGGPNWNEDADLNDDGIVDIFDLVLVGRNFGGGQEK